MADNDNAEMSDQDRIRARRLEKLGSNQPARPLQQPPPEAAAQSKPKINISSANGSSNPFSQIAPPKDQPRSASQSSPHRTSSRPRAQDTAKTIETFEDSTLSSIFRFTLQSDRNKDAHGHSLYVLHSLRADLEQSQATLRLTKDILVCYKHRSVLMTMRTIYIG